jgi:hypothetical protein
MDDLKTIRINAEVYDQVREYCNGTGLRFQEFVEDVLETAPARNEDLNLISAANETLEGTDKARKRSYRRGFWDGFCTSFFAMQGRLGLCLKKTPEELQAKNDPFKVSPGDQMIIFRKA